MEFSVHLELTLDGKLMLRPQRTSVGQAEPVTVDLPFTPDEISALSRALDINRSFTRTIGAKDADLLWKRGLLCECPQAGESYSLGKETLNVASLRDFVGQGLYRTLIKSLEGTLREHIAAMPKDSERILHVRLEFAAKDVALFQYPWELLHHRAGPLGAEIHISRFIRYLPPGALNPHQSWRVLVLHSDPAGDELPPLNLKDWEAIQAAVQNVPLGSRFELEFIDAATPTKLTDALARKPDAPTILYFAGHGEFGRTCGYCGRMDTTLEPTQCRHCHRPFPGNLPEPQGYLAFTDEVTGAPQWIDGPTFFGMLGFRTVQLVILNACKTALGRGGGDVFNGLAQYLMYKIPAVVATPFPLDNQSAVEFARCLFEGLGSGYSLIRTLNEVRHRMVGSHPDEWYRPVLYLRSEQDEGGRLLTATEIVKRGNAAPPQAKPRAVSAELIPYFIDYEEQESAFLRYVQEHRAVDNPRRGWPLICLMQGHADAGAAENLIKRLLYRLEKELPRYEPGFQSGRRAISCHDLTARPAEHNRLYTLDEQLHRFLERKVRGVLVQDQENAAPIFRQVFDRPQAFFIHLELRHLEPLKSIQRYLDQFHRFWGNWESDQQHLFLICLFVNHLEPPKGVLQQLTHLGWRTSNDRCHKELMAFRAANVRTACKAFNPLAHINRRHVEDWRDQMAEKKLLADRACVDIKLNSLFGQRETQPLCEVCDALEECLTLAGATT